MLNMRVFTPWDLTFGSGFQTVGALISVVAVGWFIDRSAVLAQLLAGESGHTGDEGAPRWARWLHVWLRFVIPGAILSVGVWWLLTDVLGVLAGA